MQKTYNINLSGKVFPINEDAGNLLQSYIEALEKHYLQEEDGKEIMYDIESRIAEIFTENLKTPNQEVITVQNVELVIQIMGSPKEIIDEDEKTETASNTTKKLYRMPEHGILGGVAYGIGTYFSISIPLVRLLFIIFTWFYGLPLWVYIILWIIIPRAVTPKQKMEMKGEPINISNIEKNIRDGYDDIRKNGKIQAAWRKIVDSAGQFLTEMWHLVGKTVLIAAKIVAVFIALACITQLIISTFILTMSGSMPWNPVTYSLPLVMTGPYVILTKIAVGLLVLIPVALLLYFCIRFIFNLRNRNRLALYALGLWCIGLLLSIFIGISQGSRFIERTTTLEQTTLESVATTPITVRLNDKYDQTYRNDTWELFSHSTPDSTVILHRPKLNIQEYKKDYPTITVTRYAHGLSEKEARERCKDIVFEWKFQGDTLTLDNFFAITRNQKWQGHNLRVTLSIPEGQPLFLDSNLDRIMSWWDFENHNNYLYSPKNVIDNGKAKPVFE